MPPIFVGTQWLSTGRQNIDEKNLANGQLNLPIFFVVKILWRVIHNNIM